MKTALITGASSGIGREIAYILAKKGYNLILVARRKDRLIEVADYVHTKHKVQAVVKVCDVSKEDECYRLYEECKAYKINVLVNGAGFGLMQDFADSDLDKELEMIGTNVKSVHILTKLFLEDMKYRMGTYILNIASSAGLCAAGPHMATYYATKAYVVSLSLGIGQELKEAMSPTSVSVLCPGPVDTEFNDVAGASFSVKPITAKECAKEAVRGMLHKKSLIIPGTTMKLGNMAQGLLPTGLQVKILSTIQQTKMN